MKSPITELFNFLDYELMPIRYNFAKMDNEKKRLIRSKLEEKRWPKNYKELIWDVICGLKPVVSINTIRKELKIEKEKEKDIYV